MAMQKFGDSEPAEVFRGREANVVSEHIQKHGKAVSDFDDNEKSALDADLSAVREEEKAEREASKKDEAPPVQQDVEQPAAVEPSQPAEDPVEEVQDRKGRSGKRLASRKDQDQVDGDGTGE